MIIGLCGKAGAGKNFIADIIETRYGYLTISFADPLKRICKDVFNFSDEQLWGPSHMRNAPDSRWPRLCEECSGKGHFDNPCDSDTYIDCDICQGVGKTYLTPREALQQLGTEWGRACYKNVWVDYAIRTAEELLEMPGRRYSAKKGIEETAGPSPSGVVISDVRFQNEMNGIKAANGKVVRIVRETTTLTGIRSFHQSETEQAQIPNTDFDYILQNVDDLDVLNASIERMMTSLGG